VPQAAVDYDALAQQARGTPAPPVDYDQLASAVRGDSTSAFNPPRWADRHPNVAKASRLALDTLPALGAVGGGLLGGGPEDVPAIALGAGAGRGLRDLIAEKVGLDPPSTPTGKASRIALDVALTAATPTILQRVRDIIKEPLVSLGDVIDTIAHPSRNLSEVADALRATGTSTRTAVMPDFETDPLDAVDRYRPNISGAMPNPAGYVPSFSPATTPPATVDTSALPRVVSGKPPTLENVLRQALEDVRGPSPSPSVSLPPAQTMTAGGQPAIGASTGSLTAEEVLKLNADSSAKYAATMKQSTQQAKQMVSTVMDKATTPGGPTIDPWQSKFVASLDGQLKQGRVLSGAQRDVLSRIYAAVSR
jgi:hypothetical protein